MDGVELIGGALRDRYGLSDAARTAATISREIARADPDPLTLTELDDRLHRYATTLFNTPHTVLLGPIVGDWRRVQDALGRRLSPDVHRELTRAAGYLSFYLGILSADSGETTSARRFATLSTQFAGQLDDRLLTGTAHSLDAVIAYLDGRLETARDAIARAAAVHHPYLHAWAAGLAVSIAATAGDQQTLDDALARLRERPYIRGLRHPGWPAFDQGREACIVADAMSRLHVPGARSAAQRAVRLTLPGTVSHGWALGALAATLIHEDPRAAGRLLDEMVAIGDVAPSRLLANRVHEILLLITTPPIDHAPRTADII
ncbi:conserved hypothetical protein [Frankia canadensis]|uniref:Uncharacterized protein n=1 Tax=Frankia canadensis TaxID=1836972 RepID=A0A2I2KV01_9ACTN|nr:hypothetical protein [Frankia canadensis]SNQ49485.1 conserved hypothetical protein [Frankia canadensis]SOU56775.1 conserved hypothetical protein [Frankia canadensis]